VTALAVATPAPASRTAAARTGTMRFTVKSLGPRRPGGYDAPMKGDGTLPHGACGSHGAAGSCGPDAAVLHPFGHGCSWCVQGLTGPRDG
jgi:hypothetical protein